MSREQELIDEVVKIATKVALLGEPVERIIWIPPQNATDNHLGTFAIKYRGTMNASDSCM